MKEESEKAGLKLNIQKMRIMASSPITSWQIDGETMQIVTYFIFLGSKVTADSDCSHKIKRCLLLGRKATTNLPVSQRSHSVLSSSLRSRGLWPTRLLHPWNFPGKSPGVSCHFLLQGIFPTQGSNPGLLHCRLTLYI